MQRNCHQVNTSPWTGRILIPRILQVACVAEDGERIQGRVLKRSAGSIESACQPRDATLRPGDSGFRRKRLGVMIGASHHRQYCRQHNKWPLPPDRGREGNRQDISAAEGYGKDWGEETATLEVRGSPRYFERLGKVLDSQFHEDCIGSLFSFKAPRDTTTLLDTEHAFNKIEEIALKCKKSTRADSATRRTLGRQ
ncbi:hypothetical protein F5Y01DRAFT_120619 [Xylaria sp. FL0043]|nr:hypothetical protein F5Y01DRAFT_120619 [Xylaria sp. FL0043]